MIVHVVLVVFLEQKYYNASEISTSEIRLPSYHGTNKEQVYYYRILAFFILWLFLARVAKYQIILFQGYGLF